MEFLHYKLNFDRNSLSTSTFYNYRTVRKYKNHGGRYDCPRPRYLIIFQQFHYISYHSLKIQLSPTLSIKNYARNFLRTI